MTKKINLEELKDKAGKAIKNYDSSIDKYYANVDFTYAVNPQIAIELISAIEKMQKTLELISKNSCCETCREASLFATSSLRKHKESFE